MVNPVEPAANFFLTFWQLLPSPVRLLIIVGAAFTFIAAIVRLIFR